MHKETVKRQTRCSKDEKDNKNHDLKDLKTTSTEKKDNGYIEIVQDNLDIMDEDKEKGMIRRGIVKEMLEKIERQNNEKIRRKLDTKEEIEKERQKSTLVEQVNKGWKNNNNDSLKEKIDERLKSIERTMIYTQDDSLAELTKKIEILNTHLDIDKKRGITVLNTTESSDNEKTDKHVRNTNCHKCKEYGHTKKNVIDIIKLLNKSIN